MKIYVLGNPDLPQDSLAVRILPHLQKLCSNHQFILKDPNEEWEELEKLTVIDVVVGIDKINIFNDLGVFKTSPKLTMHDFDALDNLRLMMKLGKIKEVKVIGLPSCLGKQTLSALANNVKEIISKHY